MKSNNKKIKENTIEKDVNKLVFNIFSNKPITKQEINKIKEKKNKTCK